MPLTILAPIEIEAMQQIEGDLVGAPDGCIRFFRTVWARRPGPPRVKDLVYDLAVSYDTLVYRLNGAGLPSCGEYLIYAMLCRAARMAEDKAFSFTKVCTEMYPDNPGSLNRLIRERFNMTGEQFRRRYDGASMLFEFRARLILPYLDAWRGLDPLTHRQGVAL